MAQGILSTILGVLTGNRPEVSRLRELVIVSAGRSGTTYVCNTLGMLQRCVSLYELFSPAGAYGFHARPYLLPHFSRLAGQEFSSERDPHLVEFVGRDPYRTVDELVRLAEANRESLLSYKVMPDQLPDDVFASQLSKRRPAVLFVVRQRLPAYASDLKAALAGSWSSIDTTELKVRGTLSDFESWAHTRDRWYGLARATVGRLRLRHITLSYDRHIDVEGRQLAETLVATLAGLGIHGPLLPDHPWEPASTKQDATAGLFDRFSNGHAFEGELRTAGKLDYALDTPMAADIWTGQPRPAA